MIQNKKWYAAVQERTDAFKCTGKENEEQIVVKRIKHNTKIEKAQDTMDIGRPIEIKLRLRLESMGRNRKAL